MEMSWIFNSDCRLHVKKTSHLVLVTLITTTTIILLIQSTYLHTFTPMQRILTGEIYSLRGRGATLGHLFENGQRQEVEQPYKNTKRHKVFLPYQAFGRETCIVRFNKTDNHSSYNLLNEFKPNGEGQKYSLYWHPNKMSSHFNGNISLHVNNPGAYSIASMKNIYIMSAFGRNLVQVPKGRTRFKQPDPGTEVRLIVQVAWLNYDLVNSTLNCCLLLGNDTIVSYLNQKRLVWTQVRKQPLMAAKFFCRVPKDLQGVKIKGATMSLPSENCLNKKFMAIEFLNHEPKDSIALCAKIAYGSLSAQRLIEWLEIQKNIGVDAVLIYYYNLNTEAMRVLLEYRQEGFVKLQPFDYPDADNNFRYVGEKEAQPFIDEQVVLYDAMERLRGYTYAAVIDVDEIIYARTSNRHHLKKFMGQLLRRSPKAAGFSFRTELFITDWENKDDMGPEMNKFWHARYQNRTRPLEDRVKNIVIMDRIILGSVWTHNYTALPGYTKFQVSASMGTLKHYRPCRLNWHCFLRRGYRDQTIATLMGNIKEIVNNKFNKLLDRKTLQEITDRAKQTKDDSDRRIKEESNKVRERLNVKG